MSHLVEGNAGSPVRVVVYEDLQCSDCRAIHRWIERRLLPAYGDRVGFEHRDFPLAKHDWARPAASVAKYFDRLDPALAVVFRRQILEELMLIETDNLADWIRDFAVNNNTDAEAAVAALNDAELAAAVEVDFQAGVAANVTSTPTMLVNGRAFVERFEYTDLTAAIEAAIEAVK